MTKLTAEAANAYLTEAFPHGRPSGILSVMEPDHAVMTLSAGPEHLRPGGYVSGPTQMTLADSVAYFAVMTRVGLMPMAVTSSLNMSFLRPCIGETVVATGKLMKLGKALAVIDVDIRIEGAAKASSHAVVTYALPRED